jgi:hypothetical protein
VAQLTAERDSLRARVDELERQVSTPPPALPAAGIEELEQLASARSELHGVRQELGHAIERARVAEERAAKSEADLLAERQGIRELQEAPVLEERTGEPDEGEQQNPFPWLNGNGNGGPPADGAEASADDDQAGDEAPQGDRSLRYRLAQSAARKKGLSDLEPSP